MPLLNGASRSGTPSDHQGWRIREKIHRGLQSVSLSLRERAMLDYAAKLTREPWNMVEDDVKALKREGFTDVGILHVN